jgi:hypothetical protein
MSSKPSHHNFPASSKTRKAQFWWVQAGARRRMESGLSSHTRRKTAAGDETSLLTRLKRKNLPSSGIMLE